MYDFKVTNNEVYKIYNQQRDISKKTVTSLDKHLNIVFECSTGVMQHTVGVIKWVVNSWVFRPKG